MGNNKNKFTILTVAIVSIVLLLIVIGVYIKSKKSPLCKHMKECLWFDVCLFNGEQIMKTRLQYLYAAVDRFYVCEQRMTFQGTQKNELYIEKYRDWFEAYMDKVVFVVDESLETASSSNAAWSVESRGRNHCSQKLITDLKDSSAAIVSVCDCDEIPLVNLNFVDLLTKCQENTHVKIEMDFYYYNLQHRFEEKCTVAYFIGGFDAAKKLELGPSLHELRFKVSTPALLPSSGWHLSYFMSPKEIIRKLQSFSHVEYSNPPFTDESNIIKRIKSHQDLFGRLIDPIFNPDVNLSLFPIQIQNLHNDLVSTLL